MSKRKKMISRVVILSFLACFLYTCQVEEYDQPDEQTAEQEIAAAKAWYESHRPTGISLYAKKEKDSDKEKDSKKVEVRPNWEYSTTKSNSKEKTVETELDMKGSIRFAAPENQEKYEATGNEDYLMSLTRLVMRTVKRTGETEEFLMTIMPSVAYLEKHKFKPFKAMWYLERDKKFDGTIIFHDMEGNAVNGWVYEDGKITHSMEPNEDSDESGLVLMAESCNPTYVTEWWEQCTDWYTVTYNSIRYNGTTCNQWTTTSSWCSSGDGLSDIELRGGYGGGGYGGGSSGGYSPPIVTQTKGKYPATQEFLDKVNEEMKKVAINLKAMGIDILEVCKRKGFIITVTEYCGVNARVLDGELQICDNFINLSETEQTAVIWHEIYHFEHDATVSDLSLLKLPKPFYPVIPSNVKKYIETEKMKNVLPDQVAGQWEYETTFYYVVRDLDYYQNEINTYKKEISMFPDNTVSESYANMRAYEIWYNQGHIDAYNSTYTPPKASTPVNPISPGRPKMLMPKR